MFTGIIEQIGTLLAIDRRGDGMRLRIESAYRDLALGESIAVSGVCLTVDLIESTFFSADASHETLSKTTIPSTSVGARVNLERALTPQSRMGGHIVAGHVDAAARVQAFEKRSDFAILTIELPESIAPLVAVKGSIAIDGISLTVNDVRVNFFRCTAIPHTIAHTTLKDLAPGAIVNVEADVVARYLARLLSCREQSSDDRLAKALETFFS